MSDIVCPNCGGGVGWGESSCIPGAFGSASCYMHEGHIRADKRNDCRWSGWVIRLENGEVRIATEAESTAYDAVVSARRVANGWAS